MTRSRLGTLLLALASVLALCVSTASPDVAAANESPSPPSAGVLAHCGAASRSTPVHVESCPAVVRASSSATVPTIGRKLPVGVTAPSPHVVGTDATATVGRARTTDHHAASVASNGARAPPSSRT